MDNEGVKLFLFVIGFFAGVGVTFWYIKAHAPDPELVSMIDQKVEVIGMVVKEPKHTAKNVQLTIESKQGRILVFADSHPVVRYGDVVKVAGKLRNPQAFVEESGNVFDYPSYLLKDNIHFTISYPTVSLVEAGQGNRVVQKLLAFKEAFVEHLEKAVPAPESSLLSGITIAGKAALDGGWEEKFKRAGVSHVVVLSGYNVTIVALVIMSVLGFLPVVPRFLIGIFSIMLFCIMAGGTSTIIRAGIMSSIFILARFSKRTPYANRILALACLLMVAFNPYILMYDPSFILSALATFGLINVTPLVASRFKNMKEMGGLKEIFCSTLAVEIFITPYIVYSMGQVSLVGLVVNLLILIFIPLTMFAGFAVGFLGFVGTASTKIPALISYVLLNYELKIVDFFAGLPFALKTFNHPTIVFPLIFYSTSLILFLKHQAKLETSFENVSPHSPSLDWQRMLPHTFSSPMEEHRAYMSVPTYPTPK